MVGILTDVAPIGQLFETDLFSYGVTKGRLSIPDIQREYQWGPGDRSESTKNRSAHQLLEDILTFHSLNADNDMPYFIGTMIIYSEENDESGLYQLMDGQQRWTTITALMGCIHRLLDQASDTDYGMLKDEISDKFLLTDEPDQEFGGRPRLASHRDYDDFTIRQLCWFGGNIETDALNPPEDGDFDPAPPRYSYNPDSVDTVYRGTNLACVGRYFADRLESEFEIQSPSSCRQRLINFYHDISSRLYLNLTLAPSASVAYKMFITANARGTPLNNYDIFKALIISRERELKLGQAEYYRKTLERGYGLLNFYYKQLKTKTDLSKIVDKVMAQVVGVLEAQRVTDSNVMMFLSARLEICNDHETLNSLMNFVVGYIQILFELTVRPIGYAGSLSYNRLVFTGLTAWNPIYVTAIYQLRKDGSVHSEEGESLLERLMSVIECFVMRIALAGVNRDYTLAMYQFVAPQANRIFEEGFNEDTLVSISDDYEESPQNPANLTIMAQKAFSFKKDKIGNAVLISAFYALEKLESSPFRKGEGANNLRKITPLLPIFDFSNWLENNVWDYGLERHNQSNGSKTIGNFFLLSGPRSSLDDITTTDIIERKQEFRGLSAGMNQSGAPYLVDTSWSHLEVQIRTQDLISKFEEIFPSSCWYD